MSEETRDFAVVYAIMVVGMLALCGMAMWSSHDEAVIKAQSQECSQ